MPQPQSKVSPFTLDRNKRPDLRRDCDRHVVCVHINEHDAVKQTTWFTKGLRLYFVILHTSPFPCLETNDLIYEGIATQILDMLSNCSYSETNDLIYEGIATPIPPPVMASGGGETNDLIYEGIAT